MAKNKKKTGPKNIVNVVWDFLSSMKLGITLLLVLAVVSIVGTIWVPVDPFTQQPDYLKFYNNPLFNMLLGLLALNLLVCSLNRWKVITSTLKGPNVNIPENFIKNLKSGAGTKIGADVSDAAQRVKDLLKKKGYRVFSSEGEDMFKVASDRGHLGILGPYLTHLSFFIMILAIMIKFSGLVGFDGTFVGWEGQTYSLGQVEGIRNVDPADYFDIKVNNFRTEYRPDGQEVKQWLTDLTVIDGTNTFNYTVFVNKPLVYKGMKFYQSAYGHNFSGKTSGPGGQDQPFEVGTQQQYVQAPGTDIALVPTGFEDATKKVKLRIYKQGQWVDEAEAVLNSPFKYENAQVTFEGVNSYTVLSAKKDPGVPIIGIGSIVLILGVVFSFLLRQRRIWAVIKPEQGGSVVQIGGISAKDKRGLDRDLDDIITELK